ncbi:MAG: metallophosphoesterase [Betaproteobacteria bacterium HGW-Betaproteobacteria-9]|jgi:predicted phosphodiesterase|nr:MAG: metallophosphoesterase [Betaproteobacteria bacterium HGW-Betaproteobacteria-9]
MKSAASIQSKVEAFDRRHEQALRRLWFAGDVHGDFQHIDAAFEAVRGTNRLPSWLVFLGDLDIDQRPLRVILEPMLARLPELRVAFIHGNHDADSYAHWECLHDSGEAVALHGRVVDLDGIRVAGLGGNFLGRVWTPPSQPTFTHKAAAMQRGPYGWRDGQRPSPKLHGAVYPDDVATLGQQRADILVTHEVPSCHPHGWAALDQLARDMGILRTFHGHTHDDRSEAYAGQREDLGFDARAVDFRCIKNGLGEIVNAQQFNLKGA